MRPYAVSLFGLAFSALGLFSSPNAAAQKNNHPVLDTLEQSLHLKMHAAQTTAIEVYSEEREGYATALIYEGSSAHDSMAVRVYFLDRNRNRQLDATDTPYILRLQKRNADEILTDIYTFVPRKNGIRVFREEFPRQTSDPPAFDLENPLKFIWQAANRFKTGGVNRPGS